MQPSAMYEKVTELYGERVAREALSPYHLGILHKPHAVGRHEAANGEWVSFTLNVSEGKVSECWFNAHGNSIIFACASVICRIVEGVAMRHALTHIDEVAIMEEIGEVGDSDQFSILLVCEALRAALLEAVKYLREPWKALYTPHR